MRRIAVLTSGGDSPGMNAAVFAVAVLVGVIESIMARLRMHIVPALIGLAGAVSAFVLILTLVR